MKFPAYPRTKPSGVEWLGDVPEHWASKRFGYLFRFYSGGTPSTSESELWDGELPWVSSKDMKSMVVSDTVDHISEEAVRISSTCKLPAGSLLMVNRSGILRHSQVRIDQISMHLHASSLSAQDTAPAKHWHDAFNDRCRRKNS